MAERRKETRDGGAVAPAGGEEVTKVDQNAITASLVWKDLTVVVSNTKTILHGLFGVAEPGRLMAIMGPSGSGKTTLLEALGGRPSRDVTVSGQILLNGQEARLSYGSAAYLAQEVRILGTLTVYETLYYSAKLRFPDSISELETKSIVKATITDVGLSGCIHTPVGSWQRRGISGGEKRRLNIAIELLTRPRLIFLDEPTSGLDSAAAYHVCRTLKALTRDGRTVILSIHQPSSEVFHVFDDLCLLAGGRQIYMGSLPGGVEFFARAGFPCPPLQNPSDHYLFLTNSDFDDVLIESALTTVKEEDLEEATRNDHNSHKGLTVAETVKTLTQLFAASQEKQDVQMKIQTTSTKEGEMPYRKGSQASFLRQSWILTRRSSVNMARDLGYYWLRVIMYIFLAITLGTIFYDVGFSNHAIQARAACIFYGVAFFTFMSMGGFPSFIEDMKVFDMERLNGHYGVAAFVIGNTLSSIPFLFLISMCTSLITYFLVGFHSGAEHFIYFVLATFMSMIVVESLMMAVASAVPNLLMGIIVGAGIQGTFVIVSGYYRLPDDLPDPVWKYPMLYLSFHMYGFQGMMENDFKGLMFEEVNSTERTLTGDYILRQNFQIEVNRSKWWNLVVLVFMAAAYRFVFYGLIRFFETLFPAGLTFINKKMAIYKRRGAAPSTVEERP